MWQDNTPGNNDIFFSRGTNNGLSFSFTPNNLSLNPGNSGVRSGGIPLATQGNNVYVVWEESGSIILRGSTNNGLSFNSIFETSPNSSHDPQLIAQGNNVYLIWINGEAITGQNPSIIFSRSIDNGQTFNNPNTLSNGVDPRSVDLIAQGNNVYVVWQDLDLGSRDIFFTSRYR